LQQVHCGRFLSTHTLVPGVHKESLCPAAADNFQVYHSRKREMEPTYPFLLEKFDARRPEYRIWLIFLVHAGTQRPLTAA
jgi:hypothetical protein